MEKFFIDKGHTATPLPQDYGTDLLVETFDRNGFAENGYIRLQLKARGRLKYSRDGAYVSIPIETKHYFLWIEEDYPVFLVLYDAQTANAYYLYIQEYFSDSMVKKPKKNAKSVTVRVPVKNLFTERTVDYMQDREAAIRNQIKGKIKHEA